MGLISRIKNLFTLDESIAAFKNKGDKIDPKATGEGIEFYPMSTSTLSSFNLFYRDYINQVYSNEINRIKKYREIAEMPEIADVIEDAVIEATQEDFEGNVLIFKILDEKLSDTANVVKNLEKEFNTLFYDRLRVPDYLDDFLRTYLIDGRVYYEKIIKENDVSNGIVGIKKLPSDTMMYEYDSKSGQITKFIQFVNPEKNKRSYTQQDIQQKEVIIFEPQQIGFVHYGIYGKTKHEILGYLEKVKIPYNQLKLLETSVVIYRLIRAPERLVFKIDVGNMPKDKAMKYVEKIKNDFQKKQAYDPSTGRLTQEPNVFSVLENFFIAQGADGRGSSIETIGGSSTAGFTELADIQYFQRKLYRALKYPLSRVSANEGKREAEVLLMRSPVGEITRDEIKWATFLQRQQNRLCDSFVDMFLLHLEFKGLKKQYNLDRSKISITLNQPSFFKDRQIQLMRETKFQNYLTMANLPEMSKYFLMKKYLEWSDEEIEENAAGLEMDKELGFKEQQFGSYGGGGDAGNDNPPETPAPDESKELNG